MSASSQTSVRGLRHLSAPRLRVLSVTHPPLGAHACGTRHRLSPRWLNYEKRQIQQQNKGRRRKVIKPLQKALTFVLGDFGSRLDVSED
jgi:hypothetical protein